MQGLPKMWLHCGSLTAKWTSLAAAEAVVEAGVSVVVAVSVDEAASASSPRSGSAAKEYVC